MNIPTLALASLVCLVASPPVAGQDHGVHGADLASASKLELHFPPGTSVVEIPFEHENGKLMVHVRVNGSEPVGFWLDTGWSRTGLLMTDDPVGLGLDADLATSAAVAGHAHRGPVAEGVRLELGNLRLEGAHLEVLPKAREGPMGIVTEDGILGGQFFESLVVEVDWEKGRMRLHDPATFEAPTGIDVLPLEKRRGHVFASGEITIGGESRAIDFIIDTGSPGTLFLRSDRFAAPERRISGVTLGQSLFGPDGNLGTGVLRRFVVTFDYARDRMLLEPTQGVEEPFPFSTSGIAVDRRLADDGSLQVLTVYAGSPAARAGVSVGDRILSVDSAPVRELGLDALRARLRAEPGSRVRLEVLREGSLREVELELEELL